MWMITLKALLFSSHSKVLTHISLTAVIQLNLSPSRQNHSSLLWHVSYHDHCCASFPVWGIHLAANSLISKSCHRTLNTAEPKIPLCMATSFIVSAGLHPCTVQLWPLTRLCKRIQNIHPDTCWQLTIFRFGMLVPTLPVYGRAGHDQPMFHTTLHGTLVHFCHKELIFSHINTVPPDGLPLMNKAANTVMLGWNVYTLHYSICW